MSQWGNTFLTKAISSLSTLHWYSIAYGVYCLEVYIYFYDINCLKNEELDNNNFHTMYPYYFIAID